MPLQIWSKPLLATILSHQYHKKNIVTRKQVWNVSNYIQLHKCMLMYVKYIKLKSKGSGHTYIHTDQPSHIISKSWLKTVYNIKKQKFQIYLVVILEIIQSRKNFVTWNERTSMFPPTLLFNSFQNVLLPSITTSCGLR